MNEEIDIAGLVLRARQGDSEASAALVRGHLRAAYVVALSIVRVPADAEDLAQEAMLVAFQKLEDCREPQKFAAWLLQIVRNRARNARVRNRLKEFVLGLAFQGEREAVPAVEEAGLRERLMRALDALTPRQREVVLLHDLEGWTHGEIAAALGLSEINSRQHLFQSRKVLRGLLQGERSEESSHG